MSSSDAKSIQKALERNAEEPQVWTNLAATAGRMSWTCSNVGDGGAREVAATLAVNKVTELNLGKNAITDAGAEAIANAVPRSKVTSLNLGANEISDHGAKMLAAMVKQTPTLCSLQLGGNMIGADGAADIAAAAALSPWLTMLDLGSNPVGEEGAAAVASAINAQTLKELNLRGDYGGLNGIGAAGAEAIAAALVENKVLSSLRLHSNSTGSMGARFISEPMFPNKSI